MKEALVSVVVPAYNAEEYLARTLYSVVEQTHQNFEIIVVDDGSTDDTNLVATSFISNSAKVRVIRVPNGGVASARNVGLQAARGEFVAFLDADDLWHPRKLELQVEALMEPKAQAAGAVYTRMRIIDEDDCVIRNGSGVGTSGYSFTRHAYARPVGNGSSILVRRSVALEVGGFDPGWLHRGIGGCEDLDFELKIAAKYPMVALPLYLVGYRSHPNNMSSNRLVLAHSVVSTVDHHLNLHPDIPDWATRKIRASALEFALELIALDGSWRFFTSQLLRLHQIDSGRARRYATRFSARKLVRDILQIHRRSHNFAVKPEFSSLDPASDGGLLKSAKANEKKNIAALALVDAQWCEKQVSVISIGRG